MGNSAAHKLELQALVAPRRKNIFKIFFWGLTYLAQRFNRIFEEKKRKKIWRGIFLPLKGCFWPKKRGLNVPLAVLIGQKFHVDAPKI